MNCRKLFVLGPFLGTIVTISFGCGSKDQKKIEEQKTYNFFYGGGEVSFEPEESEKSVVLLPYQLGDLAKIEGGGIDSFTIKGTRQGKTGLRLTNQDLSTKPRSVSSPKNAIEMTWREIDNNRRTLLNRFNPDLGMNQGEWFWELARSLDAADEVGEITGDGLNLQADSAGFGIEDFYRKAASLSVRKESVNLTSPLTSSNCPSTNVSVPDVESPTESDEAIIPSGGVVQDEDFCIVYLSDPKTESDKSKITASMKKILNIYKKTVYKDDLSPTTDGYTFKPTLVIVDFDENAGKWPSAPAYQVAGAYISALSIKEKHPMIYMAADIEKLKSNKGVSLDKDLAARQWHGTVAHEIQHAIMDYYRQHKSKGVAETPAVDEGLAHYMEDLFGYGQENFKDFAKAYLDLWAETNPPVLHASESGKIERGGAWVLWYYLVSQKGGVTFTDGIASGGAGLDFIRSAVQNTSKRGPANLSAIFGKDWIQTIGGFWGAVVVDGTAVPVKPNEFVVQDPQPVIDLTGNTGKKYGMHFNNFGGLAANRNFADKTFKSGQALEDLTYYATSPTMLEKPSREDIVKFSSTSDAPNFAAIKVWLN